MEVTTRHKGVFHHREGVLSSPFEMNHSWDSQLERGMRVYLGQEGKEELCSLLHLGEERFQCRL